MKDRFLSQKQQYKRLLTNYRTHGNVIVAFDFDNTLYDFHQVGDAYPKLIEMLQECDSLGFEIMCFTANSDTELVRTTLASYGIYKYGLNKSSVSFDSVKPYYSILLDDRAGLKSAYKTLNKLIKHVIKQLGGK